MLEEDPGPRTRKAVSSPWKLCVTGSHGDDAQPQSWVAGPGNSQERIQVFIRGLEEVRSLCGITAQEYSLCGE